MANSFFQLNYDELVSIAKKFKDEGEDLTKLHSTTRQRVRDLHKEWIGEAAEKFFEEMETELLPAVQRLAHALFLSQDMTNEIMKIIQEADEETAGYFGSGDDFGASLFGGALDGLQGNPAGADDFGAGTLLGTPAGGGGSSADDFGAGKFGDALDNSPSSSDHGDSGPSGQENSSQVSEKESQQSEKEKQPETETSSAGGGGGSGSSSSSEGLKGDLKKMGIGLSDQASQAAYAGGDPSAGNTPDHIYSGGGSAEPLGNETPSVSNAGSDSVPPSPDKGGAAAAGVAGVAGAAAAGKAAKIVKEQQEDSD